MQCGYVLGHQWQAVPYGLPMQQADHPNVLLPVDEEEQALAAAVDVAQERKYVVEDLTPFQVYALDI